MVEKIGIVTSRQDTAGRGIREFLKEKRDFSTKFGDFEGSEVLESQKYPSFLLIETEKSLLDAEHLGSSFNVDLWIFGSRHKSESGTKTLTAHAPGNWKEAKYGGNPEEMAFCDPMAIKNALLGLKYANLEGYDVSLEVTHHGPTSLKKPVLFVEIGSDDAAWKDPLAIEAVGNAILATFKPDRPFRCGVGFGGGHYAPGFTELVIKTDCAIGHITPKYREFNEKTVKESINKTIGAKFVVVDWKGLTKEKREVVFMVGTDLGIPVLRLRELLKS